LFDTLTWAEILVKTTFLVTPQQRRFVPIEAPYKCSLEFQGTTLDSRT
jgi:hypothetical protein